MYFVDEYMKSGRGACSGVAHVCSTHWNILGYALGRQPGLGRVILLRISVLQPLLWKRPPSRLKIRYSVSDNEGTRPTCGRVSEVGKCVLECDLTILIPSEEAEIDPSFLLSSLNSTAVTEPSSLGSPNGVTEFQGSVFFIFSAHSNFSLVPPPLFLSPERYTEEKCGSF